MAVDLKKERLMDFYKDLSPAKKEEVLDFVKWLWVSKESKFLERKKTPHWLEKLYLLFADVRKQAEKSSSKRINAEIEKAIREVRQNK